MADEKKEYVTKGWINLSKNNPNIALLNIDGKAVGFLHMATLVGFTKGEKKACPIKATKD